MSGSEKHVKSAPNKDFSGSGRMSIFFFFLSDKRKTLPGGHFNVLYREMHCRRGFQPF